MMFRQIRTMIAAIAVGFAALGAAAIFAPSHAAEAPAAPTYTVNRNLAVGGYDAVAYFTQGRPVQGDAQFTATYKGAIYQFSSAANRDAFNAAPQRYAPQYGGFCAWAASQGYQAPGRPQFWTIVDGKLYLNFNRDIQQRWEGDRAAFIRQADANWPANVKKRNVLGF